MGYRGVGKGGIGGTTKKGSPVKFTYEPGASRISKKPAREGIGVDLPEGKTHPGSRGTPLPKGKM